MSDKEPLSRRASSERDARSRSLSPSSSSAAVTRVGPPLLRAVAAAPPPQPPSPRNVISFDNTKAGLQNVDRARTEAIIRDMSEGSPFYQNEQRKARAREEKIQQLAARAAAFEDSGALGRPAVEAAVAALEAELLQGLRLGRIYAHIDMDMFYAACEEKKDPSLRQRPLGVGSSAMLSTTNYVARQYGVRAGMPGFIGKRLCPHLVITPCDHPYYKKESEAVRAIVREYDPEFVSLGWDELTMELSGYVRRRQEEEDQEARNESSGAQGCGDNINSGDGDVSHQQPQQEAEADARYTAVATVVAEIRARVAASTQLTCSAGIAPTSTLAKIASNYNKPNGQHTLRLHTRADIMRFMHGLKCREVPGIGKSTEHILSGLGVATVGDIYAKRVMLSHVIAPKTFRFLLSSSLGVGGMFEGEGPGDNSNNNTGEGAFGAGSSGGGWGRKSIGQERTFGRLKSSVEFEMIARENLLEALRTMKAEKGEGASGGGGPVLCGQVVLKLKHRSFRVRQYSRNVQPPSDDEEVLQRAVNVLLTPFCATYGEYRLLGVRLEKLGVQGGGANGSSINNQQQQQPTLMEMLMLQQRKRARSSLSPASSAFSISDDDDDGRDPVGYSSDEEGVVVVYPEEASVELGKGVSTISVEILSSPSHVTATQREDAKDGDADNGSVVIID